MNRICKVILAAAAVAALAAPAMAADKKLIVKDIAGTGEAFSVDNAGTVLGNKLGMGTTIPFSPLHLNLATGLTGAGAPAPIGNKLYSTALGFIGSTQDNGAGAGFVVADGTGTPGLRGNISGIRARGTLENPTAPAAEDLVFSVIGGIYDGFVVRNTADINFTVDGTVTGNGTTYAAPQRISFRTRTGGTGGYVERLTIKNDGKILLGTAGIPVYADNTAAASLTAGTIYRTATGVLMMKY